jgi:hypothetical protein
MQGYELKINIYAENEVEVEEARQALAAFINQHAQQGRAVSATKITEAVKNWERNPLVRNAIINFFK